MVVWLAIVDCHDAEPWITAHVSKNQAYGQLNQYVRENWDELSAGEDMPQNNADMRDAYVEASGDVSFSVFSVKLNGYEASTDAVVEIDEVESKILQIGLDFIGDSPDQLAEVIHQPQDTTERILDNLYAKIKD